MIIPPMLVAAHLVIAVADNVPTLDVGPGCRSTIGIVDTTVEACMNDEKAAREQLTKQWGTFSAPDKALCTDQTKNYNPSYVELLSCLEMMRDAKAAPTGQPMASQRTPSGTVGGRPK